MDLDQAKYPKRRLAELIGRDISTTRLWLGFTVGGKRVDKKKRPKSLPLTDELAKVPGATALYSARTALQLGIGSILVGYLDAKLAFPAAAIFTHEWNPLEAPGHEREPGQLYSGQGVRTALVAYPNGESAVVRWNDATPYNQLHRPAGGTTSQSSYDDARSIVLDFLVPKILQSLEAS